MVFLFAPNIVGYIRAALIIVASDHIKSFLVEPIKDKTGDAERSTSIFLILYVLNFIMDALDGFLARSLGQTSKFGACLDMVLDRLGTAMLFVALVLKTQSTLWLVPMYLDIAAHWFLTLASKTNHKLQNEPILKWYYTNLLVICVFHEAFLIALLSPLKASIKGLLVASLFPGFVAKVLVNIVQLLEASKSLAKPEFERIT